MSNEETPQKENKESRIEGFIFANNTKKNELLRSYVRGNDAASFMIRREPRWDGEQGVAESRQTYTLHRLHVMTQGVRVQDENGKASEAKCKCRT
jgi:hypothetical protein